MALFFKNIYKYLKDLIKKYSKDGSTILASSIAFYSILSIFPALLILISMSGIIIDRFDIQADILAFVEERIPIIYGFVNDNITGIIENRTGIGITGFILLFLSSTYVFDSIQFAFNRIFNIETARQFWKRKLYGFFIMLMIFIIIVITLGVSAGLFYLSNQVIDLLNMGRSISSWLLQLVSVIMGIFFNFLVFGLIYYYGTNKKVDLRQLYPGALMAAVVWEGVKHIFMIYLDRFANYQMTYGSIGSVIAFLFWVYISGMILLMGAEIITLRIRNQQKDPEVKR
jgi:membrane protein